MRRSFDLATVLFFVGALLAPLVDLALRPDVVHDVGRELRAPSPPPVIAPTITALNEFPAAAESWYGDHLGLRDVLLRARSHVYVRGLHVSPTPAVVVGRNGWVFPTLMGIIGASHGTMRLGSARLEGWRRTLESRRTFCERLGAEYVVAFAPEKTAIYADYMPAGYPLHPPSAYEQLRAWLEAHSSLQVLDLHSVERAAREEDRDGDFAYYPLGTHWTDRGMYAAYRAIRDRLSARFPSLSTEAPDELEWFDDPAEGDTWASNLRLDGALHQRARVLRVVESGYECEVGRPNPNDFRITVRGPDPSAPRLVFVHDSFGDRMRKLLARDFSESSFAWQSTFDPELIRRERPDVVIELHAERQVLMDRPAPLAIDGQDPLANAFEAMSDVLWTLDATKAAEELIAVAGGRLEGAPPDLRFTEETGSELLELRDFAFPPDRTCVVRVETTSDHRDVLDVLYRTKRMPRYRRGQVGTAVVVPGRNVVHVELDEPDLLGPLRLRLGRASGTYVLHAIEVRAAGR